MTFGLVYASCKTDPLCTLSCHVIISTGIIGLASFILPHDNSKSFHDTGIRWASVSSRLKLGCKQNNKNR